MPEDINGRGITVVNKEIVEFQIALAIDGENEAERISAISEKYAKIKETWRGNLPIKINEHTDGSADGSADGSVGDYESSPGTHYVYSNTKSDPPESIQNNKMSLILGSSKSGALQYGLTLAEDYKLCVCANDTTLMSDCYHSMFSHITEYGDRRLVFIDDESGMFEAVADRFPKCRYIKGSSAFESFTEELKPELNARIEDDEICSEQLFIVISEYNTFFGMITDAQAMFMRKVIQHIDSPKYGIRFICGFNVNGEKSNDRLFVSLIVNAENYLFGPNCYDKAGARIETLPLISDMKPGNCYLCLKDKNVAIRW
jgi:hypothetical protein